MNAYQNTYKQNQVLNASPEQILLMLYDGTILFVRQARVAIEEDDWATRIEKLGRAINILTELSGTLDFQGGGDFAENMDSLYWYMIRELTHANARNLAEPLDNVEAILVDLRDSWARAVEKVRAEGKGAEEAPPQLPPAMAISISSP